MQPWSSGWVPVGAMTLQPGLSLYSWSSALMTWNVTSEPLPITVVGRVTAADAVAVTPTATATAATAARPLSPRPRRSRLMVFMERRTSLL